MNKEADLITALVGDGDFGMDASMRESSPFMRNALGRREGDGGASAIHPSSKELIP